MKKKKNQSGVNFKMLTLNDIHNNSDDDNNNNDGHDHDHDIHNDDLP